MQQKPLHRWLMHGAVMLGREFCYALESALVIPLLLQIGLPEQYHSLTWLLSPVLGLMLGPVIGSASDRCTLRWGRRRPFILALSVGLLLGLALFLNGSLIGLSIGDTPGSQPIGIVLTVLGVVVLDFCADASEGPIISYLLDVADTEEKDIALNIHSFAGGIGGALGYMLAGLDWTDTALGRAFKSQEQVLFLFTATIFIISVILHMLSIPERPFKPSHQTEATVDRDSISQSSLKANVLDPIGEDNFAAEDSHVNLVLEMDFLDVKCVNSNSDLDLPDTAIQLDPDLNSHEVHYFVAESQYEMDEASSPPRSSHDAHYDSVEIIEEVLSISGHSHPVSGQGSTEQGKLPVRTSTSVPTHPHNRQHSVIPSHSGRRGQVCHMQGPASEDPRTIPPSRSLNDPCDIQQHAEKRSLSSEGLEGVPERGTTVRLLWISMLKMPSQLRRLCVCHLLTFFSIIAASVFYTDFMGQVIYHGDPTAPANSIELQNYNKGVQMGCWGLAVNSATACVCSALIQKCLDNFDLSIKVIYILGTLGFSIGTAVMAIFPNVYIAMVMISSMGLLDVIISYCPYALLFQYHEMKEYVQHSPENTRRGFGIDCAILSCQANIGQILVALALGPVVDAVGSVRVIPMVASGGSFLAFLAACLLVIYPDRQDRSSVHIEEYKTATHLSEET